jgi:hypothetical protein
LDSNEKEWIECNAGFFEVLGAIGTLSFGESCKCIHKSLLGSWKSSLGQSFDSITATNERLNKNTSLQTNHWSMNDQTTKQLKLVGLLPVNQSSKRVMYCDKGKDDEILSELHNSSNTQPDWHGPKPIGIGQNKQSF